jgi:hypothetical protein
VSNRVESLFQVKEGDDRRGEDLRRDCEFENLAQSNYIVNQKTTRNKSSLICGDELREKAKEARVEDLGEELIIDV